MAHPHIDVISNMKASNLLRVIEESKYTYIRENLTIHLHESQIKLLKQVRRHNKPHHKKVRIQQYKKIDEKSDLFVLHEEKYLENYKKLAKKDLVIVDENPENGLPFDVSLTGKGQEILTEICYLEDMWEEEIGLTDDDREVLKKLALNSYEITYNHKKNQKFIF